MSTGFLEEFPPYHYLIAQAEARGEAEGERDLLRRMLEQRFGTLSEDMHEAINAADSALLPDLALAAGTESLEQFRARLGLSGSQS